MNHHHHLVESLLYNMCNVSYFVLSYSVFSLSRVSFMSACSMAVLNIQHYIPCLFCSTHSNGSVEKKHKLSVCIHICNISFTLCLSPWRFVMLLKFSRMLAVVGQRCIRFSLFLYILEYIKNIILCIQNYKVLKCLLLFV